MTPPVPVPSLKLERELFGSGASMVLACDEVGRGALAGPVTVGIVLIDPSVRRMPAGLRDSKLMPEPKREAMAPRAALLSFATTGAAPDDKSVYYFAGIDAARFKRPVEPGDQLVMDVSLLRMKAGIFKFKGEARVGDELACEAELMCTMRTIA